MHALISPARIVILFWTLWYSAVVSTNTTDLLRNFGLLPSDFTWISNNYQMFVGATGLTGPARGFVVALYLGGFLWEIATAALLWRAVVRGRSDLERLRSLSRPALAVALGFWGVFMLLSELTSAKTLDLHLNIFMLLLGSLLVVELVPRPPAR